MVSPIISGSENYALVLGSFDDESQVDMAFLGRKAIEIGLLYTNGAADPRDADFYAELRQDKYRSNRRRPVPAANSEGRNLTMFDIKLDYKQCWDTSDGIFAVCAAATEEDGGHITQLPANVLGPAPAWPPS